MHLKLTKQRSSYLASNLHREAVQLEKIYCRQLVRNYVTYVAGARLCHLCCFFLLPWLPGFIKVPGKVHPKEVELQCDNKEHIPKDNNREAKKQLVCFTRLPVRQQVVEK